MNLSPLCEYTVQYYNRDFEKTASRDDDDDRGSWWPWLISALGLGGAGLGAHYLGGLDAIMPQGWDSKSVWSKKTDAPAAPAADTNQTPAAQTPAKQPAPSK
jgi:hypothetical protein